MKKVGKITKAHRALRIELEARPGAYLVIGVADAEKLVGCGATVPLYSIIRGDDVDIVEEAGTAYWTRSGKGVAINITTGVPVLPVLFASRTQVEAVYGDLRSAAVVSAPEDRGTPHREEKRVTDQGLKRGFGDDYGRPLRPRRSSPSSSGVIVC